MRKLAVAANHDHNAPLDTFWYELIMCFSIAYFLHEWVLWLSIRAQLECSATAPHFIYSLGRGVEQR